MQLATGLSSINLIVGAGDFNGDKKTDLIMRDTSGNLWLYPGNGSGGFNARTQIGQGWTGYTIVGIGDFNGDKKPDLLGRDSNGNLWLYPGTGTGGFTSRSQVGWGWNGYTLP